MTTSSGIRRFYDPDTLSIMTNAFDRACDSVPVQFRNSDRMRRKLALHIIRHITTARLMQRASQTRPSSPSSGNQLPLRWPRVRNYRKSRSSPNLTDHRFDLDAQLRNLARRNFQNPAVNLRKDSAVGEGIRHADLPYRAVP